MKVIKPSFSDAELEAKFSNLKKDNPNIKYPAGNHISKLCTNQKCN